MSTIAPITSATLPTIAAPGSASTSTIGADFNMFLKLLTTQMQNQDPLSPMDSTQYTQQLVQYSQVEQTVQQTGTLKDILASLSTQGMAQASGFIGRDAEFNSAVAGLGAKPANWTFTAPSALTTGTATITNASGKVVETRTLSLSGTNGSYSWDGTLADGTKAAAGAYSFSLTALNAAGAVVPVTVHSIGTVNSVTAKNGMISLGVNGVPMSMESLVSLAEAV